jgi:hypothetical protein
VAWAAEEALEERAAALGRAVRASEDYLALVSLERVELKEAAGTKGAAAAAAASEAIVQAQQVESTAVAWRAMAGGRWAAQRAAEGNVVATVG